MQTTQVFPYPPFIGQQVGLENEDEGSVWNNLKGTSDLFMFLLHRAPSSPMLREFSWPGTCLSLPDQLWRAPHSEPHGGVSVPLF